MLIDTHAHPEQNNYDTDRDKVISDAFESGVGAIIAVGTNITNSEKVIKLSKKYRNVFPTVGIHPTDGNGEIKNGYFEEFMRLVQENEIVGIGECGLDIYLGTVPTDESEIKRQIELFEFQIDVAKKTNLPLIIHCRNGWDRIFEIIDRKNINKGVFHCWTGGLEDAKKAIDRGFLIAFGGIVTFKNAGEIATVAKKVDLENVVLETDSPFLAPGELRGQRNEPKNVRIVAEFIARLKGVEEKEVEEVTTNNAIKLFGLKLYDK